MCVLANLQNRKTAVPSPLSQLVHCSKGSTALEFALVFGPFLVFVFGIISIGLHYLAANSLEKAVFNSSRLIRTGKAQGANMPVSEFKQIVCDEAQPYIDCSHLQVHVQNAVSWDQIVPTSCISDGQLSKTANESDAIGSLSGGASQIVLVTACYEWLLAQYIPYFLKDERGNWRSTPNLASGGMLLQASSVFRTEPYQ